MLVVSDNGKKHSGAPQKIHPDGKTRERAANHQHLKRCVPRNRHSGSSRLTPLLTGVHGASHKQKPQPNQQSDLNLRSAARQMSVELLRRDDGWVVVYGSGCL